MTLTGRNCANGDDEAVYGNLPRDESRTDDVMLYYLALKELLRDEGFFEHEALEDHDPEELLRAFANEAELEEEDT